MEIGSIQVADAWRRKGYGRLLMRIMEQLADRNYRVIYGML